MPKKEQFRRGFAPVLNGHLYYEITGSGHTILLIHAGVADCKMWNNQFQLFGRKYRVIRYDARGYGKSHTETTEFSNRQDIIELFRHLGVENAVILGISRGGQIAIDFTLEHPEYVSALIPVAAGVSGYEYQPDNDIARHEFELFSQMDELWEKKAFEQLADLETHVWVDGPSQPVGRAPSAIRDYVHKVVLANYTRQDGNPTPQPLNPVAAGRLAEIRAPSLVIVGEFDTYSTLQVANKLEQEIPSARKVVFPGTAHMVPMEKSALFNQEVLSFLKEVL